MTTDISTLPDDPVLLKEKVIELCRQYESEIDYLNQKILLFQWKLFGRKSEKSVVDASQPSLFDEAEEHSEEPKEETTPVPAHERRKRGRRPLPLDLPREDVVHDLPEPEKVCGCGSALTRIGEEVSEKLDIVPARFRVERHIRYKYACRACEGVEGDGGAVKTAPMPPQIIPQGIATPGLVAFVAISKYADSLPLYRQSKMFERTGVFVPRSTLANWMVHVGMQCARLIMLLVDRIRAGPLVNIDETPVQVMKEPGRPDTSRSYMWVFLGGAPGECAVVFRYSPTRSGSVASDFLGDYSGWVQADGFAGYDALEAKPGIELLGCWAHARRKFVEVTKASPRGKTGSGDVAVAYIRKLYAIEKQGVEEKLDAEGIRALREDCARPILNEFKGWLEKRSFETPPKGLMGKAIGYTLSRWDRLTRYLKDGRLRMDNNQAENAIRPFVVGRKNWLFSGHPRGAEASANLYSLIETAKANGLEPYAYLRFLFERLPYARTTQDYERLLPIAGLNLNPNQTIG